MSDVLRGSVVWRSMKVIVRIFTTLMFDLKVYGLHNVPSRGGALLLSNHQSNLDPMLIGVKLRRPASYMAKSELFEKSRLFTWAIRTLHAFPVRRGQGDVGAIKEALARLHEGRLLTMYPEGTRTLDGQIGRVLPGVAVVVRRARVPVLPL